MKSRIGFGASPEFEIESSHDTSRARVARLTKTQCPKSKKKKKNSPVPDARENLQLTMVSLITAMYALTSKNQMLNHRLLLPNIRRRIRKLAD